MMHVAELLKEVHNQLHIVALAAHDWSLLAFNMFQREAIVDMCR